MPEPENRILVVDDDAELCMMMKDALEAEGYSVRSCESGVEAIDAVQEELFDVVVTDIKLPRISGIDLLRHVRDKTSHTEVILMTAFPSLQTAKEAVRGQAFDYLEKPFSLLELRSSVSKAVRHQSAPQVPDTLTRYGRITIDRAKRLVRIGQEPVALARCEYELLVFLADRQGRPVSYTDLLTGVWKTSTVNDRTKTWVKTCVHRLRKKLGDDRRPDRDIQTVRGVGYQLGSRAQG